jgi:hypothetical protein
MGIVLIVHREGAIGAGKKFQIEFGAISGRIKISPEINISFLRGIYGVFTG